MGIVGTGIDITEVDRIAASIERFGARFLNRVYTSDEIAYCQSRKRGAAQSFAARFAAKEAAMKAIGTGLRRGVTWHDVEVGREPGGRPTILFHRKAAEFAAKLGMKRAALSLTHTEHEAMAQVILEDCASLSRLHVNAATQVPSAPPEKYRQRLHTSTVSALL
jgi:holo-[acyl-carrier protein] synthase